jgi:cation:H+ antiporter
MATVAETGRGGFRRNPLITDLAFVAAGLALLFVGGEGLVRGSVSIAERMRISKLVVGMVIVGFGTSTPELLVSLQAALAGSPEIAIGNVVGSNIANVLLILGLAALIWPIGNTDPSMRREAVVMLLVSAALIPVLMTGTVSRLDGLVMLVLLTVYLFVTYRIENRRRQSAFAHEAEEVADVSLNPVIAAAVVVAGLALLMLGARLLVGGATGIARGFGVSEAVIGLTIVAVGTSLPELATSVVAALRRHADVALANIVGSNIFNILAILGLTAVVTPVPVAARFATFDSPVMLAVAAASTLMLFALREIGRGWGLALFGAYAGYMFMQAYVV